VTDVERTPDHLPRPTPPRDLEHWAGEINERLCRVVRAVIEAGRLLLEAKARLRHGEWERLFQGHPHAVANALPISVNTAQRLMAIARHPIVSNPAYAERMPRAWTTLYELTKLDSTTLETSLANGRVHPALDRRGAVALRATPSCRDGAAVAALRALRRRLDAVVATCPATHRSELAAALRRYADVLEIEATNRRVERSAA
jgi:hypothetical protein